jgi:RNA polymerase-binding transcription factor DksA
VRQLIWVKVKAADLPLQISKLKELAMQTSMKTPLAARKAALDARLIELGVRLQGIERELDSHHNPDWEDLAVERETDEVLEATGLAGQAEIPQIRAALARIADGSYGQCARCSAVIPEARLDALPWTPFCTGCAT